MTAYAVLPPSRSALKQRNFPHPHISLLDIASRGCAEFSIYTTMADEKALPSAQTENLSPPEHDETVAIKLGTSKDQEDMQRMGKTPQLRRNFRFFTIFGFTMVLMATWEAMLVWIYSPFTPPCYPNPLQNATNTAILCAQTANIFGLINGGTAGLIWVYIGTYIGFFAAILSMAEMASMYPTLCLPNTSPSPSASH
jgi:hypothetical protein